MPDLIKIEDEIQLAYVMEIFVQHLKIKINKKKENLKNSNLNEIMNCFQVVQVVVQNVDANTEIETCVTSVNDFEVAELKSFYFSKRIKFVGFLFGFLKNSLEPPSSLLSIMDNLKTARYSKHAK